MGVDALQFENTKNPLLKPGPDGVWMKRFLPRIALEADVYLSTWLKTPQWDVFTGAVKNMFGAVPTRTGNWRIASVLMRSSRVYCGHYSAVSPFGDYGCYRGDGGEGPRIPHLKKSAWSCPPLIM
jgi:hypothetical protein